MVTCHFLSVAMPQSVMQFTRLKQKERKPTPWNGEIITSVHRTVLMDWILEVVSFYDLNTKCLFATTNMIDSLLVQYPTSIELQQFQGLGAACLLVTAEQHDTTTKISYVNENFSPEEEICSLIPSMEKVEFLNLYENVKRMSNEINPITPVDFLNSLSWIVSLEETPEGNSAYRLCSCIMELSLLECNMLVFRTSTIAMASLLVALSTFGCFKEKIYSLLNLENNWDELFECAEELICCFHSHSAHTHNSHHIFTHKYSEFYYTQLSLINLSDVVAR